MRILRKRAFVGGVGVVAVLAGSISISGWQTASASTSPAAPTTTVNQGLGGTSAWKVTGSVNVGNFPTTQAVSGTVNVGNLPQTQQVAGFSEVLAAETGHSLDSSHFMSTGTLDTTADKEVKVYLQCSPTNAGNCDHVQVQVGTEPGTTAFLFDDFFLSDYDTVSRIETIPGTNMGMGITNESPDPVTISYAVIGRTN